MRSLLHFMAKTVENFSAVCYYIENCIPAARDGVSMALNVTNLEGNEIADDYVRSSVPKGRWGDTWSIFKASFTKLILINIFTLITFVPGLVIMLFRTWYIGSLGAVYPFNSSIIYPYYPDVLGLSERLTLSADLMFYALLIVAGFIASVGIAGAAYSIRKLINTRGIFTVKGYFHGVKVGYLSTVLPVTLVMVFLFATFIIGDWMRLTIVLGGNSAAAITSYVFIIIATVMVGVYSAWVFAVGTSYRLGTLQVLKNAFVLMIGTPLQTLIMSAFSLIPVWLFMAGGIARIISYLFFILLGFSFILTSWTAFTQWAFDLYVNPNLKANQEKETAKKSKEELAAEKEEQGKARARELLAAGKSELISRPIMPVSAENAVPVLGKTFTRADVASVSEGRSKLGEEVASYEREHSGDPEFVEYNKLFADREKALQTETDKKGKKKKKISSDNLLK